MYKHSDEILEQTTIPPKPVFSSKLVSDGVAIYLKLT